jgi:hypothetical protein
MRTRSGLYRVQEAEGQAVQDVQKGPGRKKLIYPEGYRYRGHRDEVRGLEDEARQVKKIQRTS